MDELQPIVEAIETQTKAVGSRFDSLESAMRKQGEEHGARLLELEQKMVRRGGTTGPIRGDTWGTVVTKSTGFADFVRNGARGLARIEVKTLISAADSGGALVPPHRDPEVVAMPGRRLTIRDLLAAGETTSNAVEFVKQTARSEAAAPVGENPAAGKPQSSMTFQAVTAPVITIAHWIPVSRQLFDDAPALASVVDSDLRYGLALAEEEQLLSGDGIAPNMLGLIPQATAFDETLRETGDNAFDVLAKAAVQAEASGLPATGAVVNPLDWSDMLTLKTSANEYLSGGPFTPPRQVVWDLPVVRTSAIPQGHFLIGAFRSAAQVYDRMLAEVLISSEDRDNFIKNMLTIRAESRLALAVKRPEALIYGSFAAA
ncbi:MAG: phage major capsid protein [Geminicoccaceae bacterium]|nr:MAG: phage major capsid protein [Geminicoccaceae bacterium]